MWGRRRFTDIVQLESLQYPLDDMVGKQHVREGIASSSTANRMLDPGTQEADMKVLVIEDLPVMVAAIQVCFSIRWPDTIWVSAENGRDGLWLVESEAPDIIILDLGLPDMDGLEVLQEIRRFSDLPVIIVTSKDEVSDRVTGLELGADDYIVKPFSHIELLARAKAVLRRTNMPELQGDKGVVNGGSLSIDLAACREVYG